ncbi:hypothetical protein SAMN05192583_0885 [Sphingomonas gellani]|uniref:Uncharacterized protein n=1 Tax=Sphingomonas gellani TaxID=1166340 RepID=A0A1H7ZYG4_9SPHN|nr:hypothetical protein [Sphingomonas gellani]SEM62754.1 hypothetical protein SAMN05192583_0885 [Sphingomonas gellani]
MGNFSERRRAVIDAAFAAFGEDALFGDAEQPVRIRFKGSDADEAISGLRVVASGLIGRLRSWEVSAPRRGQSLAVAAGDFAGTYTIMGEPMLDAKRIWTVELTQAA